MPSRCTLSDGVVATPQQQGHSRKSGRTIQQVWEEQRGRSCSTELGKPRSRRVLAVLSRWLDSSEPGQSLVQRTDEEPPGVLCPPKVAVDREKRRTLNPCSSSVEKTSCFLCAVPVPTCVIPSPHGEVVRGLPGNMSRRQLEGTNGTGCRADSCQRCPYPPCRVRTSPKSTAHLPHTSPLWLILQI